MQVHSRCVSFVHYGQNYISEKLVQLDCSLESVLTSHCSFMMLNVVGGLPGLGFGWGNCCSFFFFFWVC